MSQTKDKIRAGRAKPRVAFAPAAANFQSLEIFESVFSNDWKF